MDPNVAKVLLWLSFAGIAQYPLISFFLLVRNTRAVLANTLITAVEEPVVNAIVPPAVYFLAYRIGYRLLLLIFISLRTFMPNTVTTRCKFPRFRVYWLVLVSWLGVLLFTELIATSFWLARNNLVFVDDDAWRTDFTSRVALNTLRFLQIVLDAGNLIFSTALVYYVAVYKITLFSFHEAKRIMRHLSQMSNEPEIQTVIVGRDEAAAVRPALFWAFILALLWSLAWIVVWFFLSQALRVNLLVVGLVYVIGSVIFLFFFPLGTYLLYAHSMELASRAKYGRDGYIITSSHMQYVNVGVTAVLILLGIEAILLLSYALTRSSWKVQFSEDPLTAEHVQFINIMTYSGVLAAMKTLFLIYGLITVCNPECQLAVSQKVRMHASASTMFQRRMS